jgi:hypothetical protein
MGLWQSKPASHEVTGQQVCILFDIPFSARERDRLLCNHMFKEFAADYDLSTDQSFRNNIDKIETKMVESCFGTSFANAKRYKMRFMDGAFVANVPRRVIFEMYRIVSLGLSIDSIKCNGDTHSAVISAALAERLDSVGKDIGAKSDLSNVLCFLEYDQTDDAVILRLDCANADGDVKSCRAFTLLPF